MKSSLFLTKLNRLLSQQMDKILPRGPPPSLTTVSPFLVFHSSSACYLLPHSHSLIATRTIISSQNGHKISESIMKNYSQGVSPSFISLWVLIFIQFLVTFDYLIIFKFFFFFLSCCFCELGFWR